MPSTKRHLFPTNLPGLIPSPSGRCPICNTGNADFAYREHGSQRLFQGWCPGCTNVRITNDAADEVKRRKAEHLLSAYLRRLPAEDWNTEVGIIAFDELDRLTSSVSELHIIDQFDLALKIICDMCPFVGEASAFHFATDWPLLTVPSERTALFILKELARAGYLEIGKDGTPIPPKPTFKAYERLQQIQASGRNSLTGFVAMSFSSTQLEVWHQVIEPGIAEAGYQPVRVDQYGHNKPIDDEIIAQIRRCRFLVADFTEQKKGVYFEAGFALGLGRKVIWMCRQSEVDDLHFDTRQFNHILYDDLTKARKDLTNRIVALEGPGDYIPQKP